MFDPDNYDVWCFNMWCVLAAEGCYGAIDNTSNNWVNASPEAQMSMQLHAFNTLHYSLGPSYQYISGEHQIHEAKQSDQCSLKVILLPE